MTVCVLTDKSIGAYPFVLLSVTEAHELESQSLQSFG